MFKSLNLRRITPELVLRLGLAGTFLYAGISSLANPSNWIGFIPQWTETLLRLPRETLLLGHGILELLLALALILGIAKRATALIIFFDIALIILLYGIDDVTFRDFGLLMMSLALFLSNKKKAPA